MEATIAEFTYTKDDGSRSQRKLLVFSQPSDSYFGVEVKTNDLTDVANVLDYLAEKEKMDELLRLKYGLDAPGVRYRRFKAAKVSALTEDQITI